MKRQSRFDFDKFVDVKGPEECWPWKGALSAAGHGRFGAERQQWYAHRLVWERLHGWVPRFPDGVVMHRCNNAGCCNPVHLMVGTIADNVAHAGACGVLSRKGTQNGNSKLTLEQVEAIRKDPRPSRYVARDFNIEKTQVLRIRRGVQWVS